MPTVELKVKMKHIGLIGGIGPAATDFYYRRIISAFAQKGATLDLTIAHADSPTLLANLAQKAATSQIEIYQRLTDRLAKAGAASVAVTAISGHFCIDAFKEVSPLPVNDMLQVVREAVADAGYKNVGLLGTRTVMQSRLYGAIQSAKLVAPSQLDDVHDAYVGMAAAGRVTDTQRQVFLKAIDQMQRDEGVEAVMLAGTDLTLAFDDTFEGIPLIDCAALHADAIVRDATAGS
ncbi:MAG: aspartate/glutamate racemase family protein [Myxococcota bacterium]